MKTIKLLRGALIFFCGLILAASSPAEAAAYIWTNTAGGNWNLAANWSPNGVPGASDSAALTTTGSYTVTVSDAEAVGALTLGASSGDTTAQTLSLTSGTLTLNNASTGTAQGILNVSAGTLAGAAALALAGPLNWTGGEIEGTVQFNGGTINGGLNLYGTLVNSGALAWSGALYMYGGVLTNLASGTINLASGTGAFGENGSPDLDNDGQFIVAGPGTASIGIPFNNNGTVTVNGGTLDLSGGGTEIGSFTVPSGATLELGGGTFTLNSASSISGAGNFVVGGGTAGLGGMCNVAGTYTFSAGVANVTGACTINSALVISGGTLNLNGTGPITPTTATISGGAEAGSQAVQVQNAGGFNWTGGAIEGAVQFNGGTINGGLNLYGTLVNSGALAWSGALYMYGGVLTNLASGTINLASGTGAFGENGSPDLDNEGQFNMAGPGTASIVIPFNNNATVTVNGGTLDLSGGGTENGSFAVASGATLELGGGTIIFNPASSISGAGNFTVGGGTAGLGGTCNLTGTNTFSAGVANVTGAFAINGALVISGGTLNLNGTGQITPPTATINGGAEAGSQAVQVQNAGGFNWTGGVIEGTVQFNGGTVNGGLNLYGALVNSGALAWSGTLYMYGGVLTNLASGTINLASGTGASSISGSPDLDNDGQFNVSGPGTSTVSIPFNNQGTVAINSGTLNLNGPYSLTNGALNFGISNAVSFGSLHLTGDANLTCALEATFLGYSPKLGDTFGLISYGSESGFLSALNLPTGIVWQPEYGPAAFSIVVVSLTEPAVTLQVVQPPLIANAFTLLMLGPIGSNYMIQASTDPALKTWLTLTNFTSIDTSFYYTDTNVSDHDSRLFRAVLVR